MHSLVYLSIGVVLPFYPPLGPGDPSTWAFMDGLSQIGELQVGRGVH